MSELRFWHRPAGAHLSCSEQSPAASHHGAQDSTRGIYCACRCWSAVEVKYPLLAALRWGQLQLVQQQKAVSVGAPPPQNLMAKAKDVAPPQRLAHAFIRQPAKVPQVRYKCATSVLQVCCKYD